MSLLNGKKYRTFYKFEQEIPILRTGNSKKMEEYSLSLQKICNGYGLLDIVNITDNKEFPKIKIKESFPKHINKLEIRNIIDFHEGREETLISFPKDKENSQLTKMIQDFQEFYGKEPDVYDRLVLKK